MNYELAQKLKDVGFHQEGDYIYAIEKIGDKPIYMSFDFQSERTYYSIILCSAPTLSELIEACGDSFNTLENRRNDWCAQGGAEEGYGQIPEEAVANLWLVLNKKNEVIR